MVQDPLTGVRQRRPSEAPLPAATAAPAATDEPAAPTVDGTIPLSVLFPPAVIAAAGACGAGALLLYLRTLQPCVAGGDSGEVVVAAYNLGSCHPPGYPLYVISYHLWLRLVHFLGVATIFRGHSHLEEFEMSYATGEALKHSPYRYDAHPSCDVALYANMFSAILTAVGVTCMVMVGWLLQQGGRTGRGGARGGMSGAGWFQLVCAVFAGLLYGTMPTVWLHALHAEVFAWNNLLIVVLALLTALFAYRPTTPTACAGALTCGLGLANQHILVFYVAPFVLFVFIRGWPALARPRAFTLLSISFFAGLSPYLILVRAAFLKVPETWGDQRTVGGFFYHLLRMEYGTFRLAERDTWQSPFHRRMAYFLYDNVVQMNGVGYVACMVGVVACLISRGAPSHTGSAWLSRRRDVGAVFVFAYIFYSVVFGYLSNLGVDSSYIIISVQHRFWQQSYILLCTFAGPGAYAILDAFLRFEEGTRGIRKRKLVLAVILVACAIGAGVAVRYPSLDHSQRVENGNFGRQILMDIPPATNGKRNIIMLTGDLPSNAVQYMRHCEGVRPDVLTMGMDRNSPWYTHIHDVNFPGIEFPGEVYDPYAPGGYDIRKFLAANYPRFNVYLMYHWKDGDNSHEGAYTAWNVGMVYRVQANTEPMDLGATLEYIQDKYKPIGPAVHYQNLPHQFPWERSATESVRTQIVKAALEYARVLTSREKSGTKNQFNIPTYRLVTNIFERIIDTYPMNDPAEFSLYRDYGVVLGHMGKEDRSYTDKMLKAWRLYLEFNEDADIRNIVDSGVNPYGM